MSAAARAWIVSLALPGQAARVVGTTQATNASEALARALARWPLLPVGYVLLDGEPVPLPADQTSQSPDKPARQNARDSRATPAVTDKQDTDKPAATTRGRGKLTPAQERATSERWRRYWLAKHPPDKPPQAKPRSA